MNRQYIFYLFLGCSILFISDVLGQKKNESFVLNIKKASSKIIIDGVRDEQAWTDADIAKDFHMILPMDTSKANVRTEVQMTYDDQNIYLIAVCYAGAPGPNFVESLQRDWSFGRNDNFIYNFDTFDDQTNGFTFGTNAAGAQWDGTIFEGGRADLSWDNKWVSVVKNYDDRYVFEMALPFKSIRYKEGITQWGINFSRNDLKTTEKSSWAPVPRQFPSISLAYTGVLQWDAPPPAPKQNVSIIPYALTRATKDHENGGVRDFDFEVGTDAKVAITSSLNLDLTINPDFSQVEVDQQVTNLDRFELFFPERRQFFLENGDLFSNFGYSNIRPFFSRRIGLGVPIRFGARLSGKLNKDWRLGAMNMQTAEVERDGLPAQNFTVLSLQRRVFARSNIGVLVVNKQSLNYDPDPNSDLPVFNQYDRNLGLEYNLASSNNLWTGKALFLKSFSPQSEGNNVVQAANLEFRGRKWQIEWSHEYVGRNYTAEVGFVPRTGYIRFSPEINYNFFPEGKLLLSHGPSAGTVITFDPQFALTDNTTFATYNFQFRKRDELTLWTGYDYVQLLFPFDPTNTDGPQLPTLSEHTWNSFGFNFSSRPQSLFTYSISTRFGGYYEEGNRQNTEVELGYRFQPFVNFEMIASRNDIQLREPWGNTVFWLFGPKMEITFTNKIYWTTFFQYNDQLDNINLNTRFQWRYSPASDLFIVYTDNYLPEPFNVKNRSLVLKFTYWWNL